MSRYSDQTEETASGERRVNGILMCIAQDCPLRASISLGGGWLCACHAFAPASRWTAITKRLRSREATAARRKIADLRRAIKLHQTNDIPALMRRVQETVMAAGATSEDVRLHDMTDHTGATFREPPEAFVNRMDFCLSRIIAPEEGPIPAAQSVRDPEPKKIDALASIVEEGLA